MDKNEKISRKIKRMKKYVDFRNILVHMYEEVDIGELHTCMQNNLVDFDEFAKYIARHLEKEEE